MYILYYSLLVLGISIYSYFKERTKNDFSKVKRLTNFFVVYPLKIISIVFILYGIKKLIINCFLVAFQKDTSVKESFINKFIYSDAYFVSMILLYSFIGPKNFAFFIFFFMLIINVYNLILNETNPDVNVSLFPYKLKYSGSKSDVNNAGKSAGKERSAEDWIMMILLIIYIIIIIPILVIILCLATYAVLFLYVIDIGE